MGDFKGSMSQEKGPSKYFICLPPADRVVLEGWHGLAVYKHCFQATNELMLLWSLPLLFHEPLERYFQPSEMTQNVNAEVLLLAKA